MDAQKLSYLIVASFGLGLALALVTAEYAEVTPPATYLVCAITFAGLIIGLLCRFWIRPKVRMPIVCVRPSPPRGQRRRTLPYDYS